MESRMCLHTSYSDIHTSHWISVYCFVWIIVMCDNYMACYELYVHSLYFVEGLVNFLYLEKITQLIHAPRVSSVTSLLSVVRKGLPIPVIISWKHFTSFRNLSCRIHTASWWPVHSIGQLWTVSNFWRKLKHLAFTCIMLWHLYWHIVIGSHHWVASSNPLGGKFRH